MADTAPVTENTATAKLGRLFDLLSRRDPSLNASLYEDVEFAGLTRDIYAALRREQDAEAERDSLRSEIAALREDKAREMPNESTTDYLAHFNRVTNNYGEALLEDRGGERHQRAARSLDILAREYVQGADLLDRIRGHCCKEVEGAFMAGEDFRAVAARHSTTYPPLADDLRDFCEVLVQCSPDAARSEKPTP